MFDLVIRADEGDEVETQSGTVELRVLGKGTQGTRVVLQQSPLLKRTEVKPRADGRPVMRIPLTSFPAPFTQGLTRGHEITVDERGNAITENGGVPLPYALGTVGSFLLEAYPEQPQEQWKRTERTTITITQGGLPFPGRILPPPPVGFPGRRGTEPEGDRLNAEETTGFQLEKPADKNSKSLIFRRTYALKTFEKEGDGPRLEIVLSGRLEVDPASGLPRDLVQEGTLVSRKGNTTSKVPLKLTLHRLTVEELKKRKDEQEKSQALAREAAEKMKAPLTAEERKQVLADLASAEKFKLPQVIQKLEHKTPAEADPEMAAALAKILASGEAFQKMSAARALEKWATNNEVGLLAEQMDKKDILVAPSCMKALGRLKAVRYAPTIAGKLKELQYRTAAKEALKMMGSGAEEAVIPYIESDDLFTRAEVCEILGEIGTASSVGALRYRADKDDNGLVKIKAKQALENIEKRKQQE